nr:glycoside hydrolase family 32 protein [Flexivirga aerilata]
MHIRPAHGWLNDPNGIVRHRDVWHVFYQANPHAPVHGDIQWGHASSADLVHWQLEPIAFGPEPDGPDAAGCWSGVHLPWLDRPAVAYSGVVDDTYASTVCVREALDDDLLLWSAPRVVARTPPEVSVMRDPFCFTWGGRRWALLGARVDDAVPAVLLFSVDDPESWHYEGVWLRGDDLPDGIESEADIWECPQLVVGDAGECALIVSLQRDGVLGRVQALRGRLVADGDLPRFAPRSVQLLDTDNWFYAPQVASDGATPLLFGWIRDVDKPADAGAVSGCLTLPRRLELTPEGLRQRVATEFARLADDRQTHRTLAPDTPLSLPPRGRVRWSAAADLTLRAGDVTYRLLGGPGVDLWTDGEVVEILPPSGPTTTLRASGSEHWLLETAQPVTAWVAELPPTLAIRAETGAHATSA